MMVKNVVKRGKDSFFIFANQDYNNNGYCNLHEQRQNAVSFSFQKTKHKKPGFQNILIRHFFLSGISLFFINIDPLKIVFRGFYSLLDHSSQNL